MKPRKTEAPGLAETDVRGIVRILGDVAMMNTDPGSQRVHLMQRLAALLEADSWVWAVTPLLVPGKQPVYLMPHTSGFDEDRLARYLAALEHPDTGVMTAPMSEAVLASGSQVTRHRDQIVSAERYAGSPARPFWEAAGIGQLVLSIRPVPEYGITSTAFYRPVGAPVFTERETRIAHIVLSEVPLLHVAGMPHAVARPLPGLPPRCRLIINQLVAGHSRKTIATTLGLGQPTVNDYVKRIFAHFRVHSQVELIARFTRGDGGDIV